MRNRAAKTHLAPCGHGNVGFSGQRAVRLQAIVAMTLKLSFLSAFCHIKAFLEEDVYGKSLRNPAYRDCALFCVRRSLLALSRLSGTAALSMEVFAYVEGEDRRPDPQLSFHTAAPCRKGGDEFRLELEIPLRAMERVAPLSIVILQKTTSQIPFTQSRGRPWPQ